MWGKILITVMLNNGHWVIMTYSEKLSDIKALGEMGSLSYKKANIYFANSQTIWIKIPVHARGISA